MSKLFRVLLSKIFRQIITNLNRENVSFCSINSKSNIRQKVIYNKMDTERNIEVKANLGSDEKFLEKVEIAKKLTNSDGQIIKQHDVFFNAITGRLKLRYLDDAKSQLVQYDRPNVAGPKLSKFNKIEVDDPKLMEKILTDSIGVKGEVKKVRTLFLHEQTRIHLDKVENLGNYLEFEVCLKPTQTIDEGKLIAEKMMEIFGIQSYELMEAAYLDSLLK